MQQSELISAIEEESQFSPDRVEFDRDLIRVLNRAYRHVLSEETWPFLIREAPLWVTPDFTIDVADFIQSTSGGVPNTKRAFFVFFSELQGAGLYDVKDQNSVHHIVDWLYNATVELDDFTKRALGNGNWSNAPFMLDHIQIVGALFLTLWLDPRADITNMTGLEGPIRFAFPRWRLPGDVGHILEVRNDRGQKLRPLSVDDYRRRFHLSERPAEGSIEGFSIDEGQEVRYPPLHPYHFLTTPVTDLTTFSYGRANQQVLNQITVTEEVGASSFVNGRSYRFFVNWFYQGRFGPPSNIVELTMTAAGNRPRLGNLPQLPDNPFGASPPTDYGWKMAVWVSEGKTNAFYLWGLFDALAPAAGNELPLGSPVAERKPWSQARYDEIVPPQYKYLRLYPRPAQNERLIIRYHARVPQLLEPSDQPVMGWNEDHHDAIIWHALMTLSSRWSGEAFYQRCAKMYERALDRMRTFYQPGKHLTPQKGLIGQRSGEPFPLLSVTLGEGP